MGHPKLLLPWGETTVLGRTIGNALEVREAIDILRGEGPADTTQVTYALGAEMLCLGGVARDADEGRHKMEEAVRSGAGLDKFRAIIEAQHGDPKVCDDPDRLPTASATTLVEAPSAGHIAGIDSFALGMASMKLGAGRRRAEDNIDPAVGIELLRTVGDRVDEGEPIARLHHNSDPGNAALEAQSAFELQTDPVERLPLIIDRLE